MRLGASNCPILHTEKAKIVSHHQCTVYSLVLSGKTLPTTFTADMFLDSFFGSLVNGTEGIPLAELEGSANEQRLMDAIQRLYRRFMTQALGTSMRNQNAGLTDPNATPMGTQFSADVFPDVLRVVQNSRPKLILQCMLGVLVVCLVGGYWDLRGAGSLLYHSPTSIAAKLSLLAGSRLVREIDTYNYNQQSQMRPRRLQLGWWDGSTKVMSIDPKATSPRARFGVDWNNEVA